MSLHMALNPPLANTRDIGQLDLRLLDRERLLARIQSIVTF